MAIQLAALRQDYNEKWKGLEIRPEWRHEVDDSVLRIARGQQTYREIEAATGVPWFVVGLIHELEASCNFSRQLHNGDLLTARTRNEPKGRPAAGSPPFTFMQSAVDALACDALDTWKEWDIAGISWKMEGFNGFGYRKKAVENPYLYSGSNWYHKGKYVADGLYVASRVSKQLGCIVILRALVDAKGLTVEVK